MHPDNLGKQFDRHQGLRREIRNGEALLPMTSGAPKSNNIVWHNDNTDSDEHLDRAEAAYESQPSHPAHWNLPADVTLHTTQTHFGSRGIRQYMKNPETPSLGADGRELHEDLPEVFVHQGKHWIHEGHHRIIASRLSGEPSIKVHVWDTGK